MIQTFENIREKKNGFEFLDNKKDQNAKNDPTKAKVPELKIAVEEKKDRTPEKQEQKDEEKSKKSKKDSKSSKPEIDEIHKQSVKDSKSAKDLAEVKSKTLIDYSTDLGRANAALRDEFQSTEDEFEKFANENGLTRGTQDTLLKLVKQRLVRKLIENKIKVKNLSWFVLYELFKKHASKERRYAGTRVLLLDKSYPEFLKELSLVMAPFEEIGPHIERDIKKMHEFDADSTLTDDQFYFAAYLRNVQK